MASAIRSSESACALARGEVELDHQRMPVDSCITDRKLLVDVEDERVPGGTGGLRGGGDPGQVHGTGGELRQGQRVHCGRWRGGSGTAHRDHPASGRGPLGRSGKLVTEAGAELEVRPGRSGAALPDPRAIDGLIVLGGADVGADRTMGSRTSACGVDRDRRASQVPKSTAFGHRHRQQSGRFRRGLFHQHGDGGGHQSDCRPAQTQILRYPPKRLM